jgi:hypothetical protein
LSAVAHIKEYKTGKFYRDEFRGDISWNGYEHNVLLRNEGQDTNGTPQFTDVAMATGADDIKDGRGMAIADFDNDGALDIVINNNPGDNGDASRARPTLLHNNIGSRRNWLAVELEGIRSNRDAVGALVTIETGREKQLRLVSAGSGFASQNSVRLYFGTNDKPQIDALTVRWPSGLVEHFEKIGGKAIATGQVVRIREGTGIQALSLPAKLQK